MGCNHPHTGRPGGCTGILGDRWFAGMGGTRIVPPIDYHVRYSGRAGMKRGSLSKPFHCPPKRKDRPFGRSFSVGQIFVRSGSLIFHEISDFSEQFLFT